MGSSGTGNGVHGVNGPGAFPDAQGFATTPNGSGVFGESNQFEGVIGVSTSGPGVHGINGGAGVALKPKESCGVWGESVVLTMRIFFCRDDFMPPWRVGRRKLVVQLGWR